MEAKTRIFAAIFCAAILLLYIWGVSNWLTSTAVTVVVPPPSTSQTDTDTIEQQVIQALQRQNATTGTPLTAEFLQFCESQSPGLCQTMLQRLQENLVYQDTWFYEISKKTLHYYTTMYQQPLADNVHVTEQSTLPITLAFTGDVNFADDWYNMQHYATTNGISDCFGASLLKQMQNADILLCNNEFTFSDRGTPMAGKQFTFRAKTANVSMWQELGVDLVSLANNHCYDYGTDAFYDTLTTLQDAGIPYVGAGQNLEEAMRPQFFLAGGMKIGYIACTRAEKYILTPEATQDSPGVLRCYDPTLAVQAIEAAKAQCDYLVVYVHWGTEESTILEQAQIDLADAFQQAGADLIVGAHPHILQGAGWREDTPVVYSLGNFWFNMQSQDTAMLNVTLLGPNASDALVQILPCRQSNGKTTLLESASDKQRVLDHLNSIMESGYFDENGILHKN